jgi:class 3 adenylate cyclase/putative methionine-R-sulfoxide reductase with GAF domain
MAGDPPEPAGLREQIAQNQQAIDRLTRELDRKSDQVRIIQQISSEITSSLDLDEVLGIVLRAMDRVLGFSHSMILLKDLGEDVLRVSATRGYPDQAAGAVVPLGQGVIGVVADRRRMMRIGNIGATRRYLEGVRARMEASGEIGPGQAPVVALPGLAAAQSQLALPLIVKDRLVGVLAVESGTPNAFDELDEILLRIVGNQAATAIDNARSYQMVERLGRLKRFFSPQLADLILRGGADDPLKTHRRDVTVVFLDLRGFTAFTETSEPEELMGVLHEYHAEMGRLILAHEGTLERFTGDGMMVFFNDPLPMPDAAERAVRMAVAMRDRAAELSVGWRRRGYDLDLGIGIANGFATIGAIGFEGRWDYGAIGTVTNLAARLCAEARPGQILISPRVLLDVEGIVEVEELELLTVKGLARPVKPLSILRLRAPR